MIANTQDCTVVTLSKITQDGIDLYPLDEIMPILKLHKAIDRFDSFMVGRIYLYKVDKNRESRFIKVSDYNEFMSLLAN